MPVSGRVTDRLVSIAIYAGIGVFTLWAGSKLINHSLETKFYKDFLLKWEIVLQRYKSEGGSWPAFSQGNRIAYMDNLTQRMVNKGMSPPTSNTGSTYTYRLWRLGYPREHLSLLCFSHKMIIYGVSKKTFEKIDTWVDGSVDYGKGLLTGRLSKDGVNYVGVLKL